MGFTILLTAPLGTMSTGSPQAGACAFLLCSNAGMNYRLNIQAPPRDLNPSVGGPSFRGFAIFRSGKAWTSRLVVVGLAPAGRSKSLRAQPTDLRLSQTLKPLKNPSGLRAFPILTAVTYFSLYGLHATPTETHSNPPTFKTPNSLQTLYSCGFQSNSTKSPPLITSGSSPVDSATLNIR